jgi:hypothetical protein
MVNINALEGMFNMRGFMCQHCKWVMAADASYAAWPELAYLDISGNPLDAVNNLSVPFTWLGGAPTNVLPTEWETISLTVLRVRRLAMLCCRYTISQN